MNSWTWIDIKQGQTVHKRAINIYIERERCRNNINTKRQKCRETKIIGDSEELSYQSLDRSGVYFFFAYNSQKSLSIRNSDIIQVKIFMIHFILSPLYLFFFSYFWSLVFFYLNASRILTVYPCLNSKLIYFTLCGPSEGGDGSLWSYTNTPCELVNISE